MKLSSIAVELAERWKAVLVIFLVMVFGTWLWPSMLMLFGSLTYPRRAGIFMRIADVDGYFNYATGVFAATIVWVILALIVMLLVVVYFFRKTLREYRRMSKSERAYSMLTSPCVRIVSYVLMFVAALMISVAVIMDVACVENHEIKKALVDVKYFTGDAKEMRAVAKRVLEDGSEMDEEAVGAALVIKDGLVLKKMEDGGVYLVVLGEEEVEKYGEVKFTDADGNVSMMKAKYVLGNYTGALLHIYADKTPVEVMMKQHIKKPNNYKPSEAQVTGHLMRMGISVEDLKDKDSLVHKFLEDTVAGGSAEDGLAHYRHLMNDSFTSGVSLAYLITAQNHGIKTMMGSHASNKLDLEGIKCMVETCEGASIYALVLYCITVVLMFVGLIALAVSQIQKGGGLGHGGSQPYTGMHHQQHYAADTGYGDAYEDKKMLMAAEGNAEWTVLKPPGDSGY